MKKILTLSFLVVLFISLSENLYAQRGKDSGGTAPVDITGTYQVEGINPDGSAYTGTCKITTKGGGNFYFYWQVGTTYEGTGKLQGNKISVDFGDTYPVIYIVKNRGKLLDGTWANGTATETLSK